MNQAERRNTSRRAERLIRSMRTAVGQGDLPSVSQIARERKDPFRVLVSTIISLRTKDEVTMEASRRLFRLAATPKKLRTLPLRAIERAIFPAGFYKTKARNLKEIARRLEKEYDSVVPDSVDELLTFKGVGRKTATLVVSLGYGKDAICVDTHVHRVSNRLGLVETLNPDSTELALMDILPRKYWIGYNELLVSFGQQVCKPISPHCTTCPVTRSCPRVDVDRFR
ncbi:MAG: endonuclease III [Candidatus Krumholzibacteriota bacterium]|nr:endonuclease III [Candidatus Krumholzibacteriota bacterium]